MAYTIWLTKKAALILNLYTYDNNRNLVYEIPVLKAVFFIDIQQYIQSFEFI